MHSLASIKSQYLNFGFFLDVSTTPHKSFTAMSSGLGGRRIEMAIDLENFVFCCKNLRVVMKERKCPE